MKFLQRKGLESIMQNPDDFLEGFGYVQQRKKAQKHEFNKRLGLQKLLGVGAMILGLWSVPVTGYDVTGAFVLIPLGIYLVLTNTLYLN